MNLRPPEKWRSSLKIGTCSWKYDSWKGLVYESGKSYRPQEYLADYAKKLDSVEIDQWFWSLFPGSARLPEPRDVRLYAESVPDDFVFTVKAPNALTLTHFYAKREGSDPAFAGTPNPHFLDSGLLEKFLDCLAPLGKKLGPVMFQFEYLNKKKMPSREAFFEAFGAFIQKAPGGFSWAVEIRNPNYLTPDFFAFLEAQGLGFVYLDGYYMPPIGTVFDAHKPRTAAFNIIRLHGGDRGEIEKETGEIWNAVVAPKPAGLKAAAEIVKHNLRHRIQTYVNVNNHYEGSAPLTIGRFLETLESPSPDSPDTLPQPADEFAASASKDGSGGTRGILPANSPAPVQPKSRGRKSADPLKPGPSSRRKA
jgi:uncharacterized protein YecE (DUF72 family)